MDDDKNKGFKGSYKASPVRTGNLAHSTQTQLPDHVYRLSPRNVKPLYLVTHFPSLQNPEKNIVLSVSTFNNNKYVLYT